MSESDADEKRKDNRRGDDDKLAKTSDDRPLPLKVIKAEEDRRNLRWLSFTRAKVSFGFQHLSAAYVPTMLDEPHGLCICLEKVSGWSIPSAVLKEFGKGDFEITAQLSFSMFHLSSSTFFGTTWMGPSVSLGHGNSEVVKTIDFEYTDIVYMLSRITDPTCVGIIEIVVSKFDLRKNLVAAQFGCGWTIINLFAKPPPPDIAEGHENVSITSCSLFAGSPRDLIINTDMKTLASRLKEIPDSALYFKLFSHRRLLKAHKLIAENEALGRFDTVAGLVPRGVAPPGSTQKRMVSCIGDEELMDDRHGVLCLPATPRLCTPFALKMGNLQLYMPNRRAVEIKMLEEYASLLQLKDASKVMVVSRKLRIGLHNGNTVLGGDWQSQVLLEDKQDNDVLFTPTKSDITVDGYVPDIYMALAFMVEYELGIPAAKNTHFNSQAMMRSTTWQDGRLVTAFTVCAAVFIPFNGSKLLLRNTERRGPDEDGVDIELKLLKDEACTILSARPLLLFNEKDQAASAAAQGKDRMSLRAGDKNAGDRDNAGSTNAQVLEEEDTGTPLLGFDMRVFHPTEGEIMHNQDVTALLLLDQKKSTRTGAQEDRALEETRKALRDRDDESKDGSEDFAIDATGNGRSFRGSSSFKSKGFTVTARKTGTLGSSRGTMRGELVRERDRGRYDGDTDSIAESIVTGDSGHSSLRLDALYYTSAGRTRDPRSFGGGQGGWDTQSERSSDAGGPRGLPMQDARFTIPRDKGSLLAQSLQTKLVSRDHVGSNLALAASELLPEGNYPSYHPQHQQYADSSGMRIAPKTSVVGINSNAAHIRDLSRGARSRLSRHGFDGAIIDTPLDAVLGDDAVRSSQSRRHPQSAVSGKNVVVDIDQEARDELSLHEINIQFAGYRVGPAPKKSASGAPVMNHYAPKSVYFSFQFYSCMATRTEIMRLLPAEPGQLCVLARDEAYARDETPLTLRFLVDCSTASPNEAVEFAEYLAHCSLYVDVWDADSLLHLGTCGIPLRRLMRQGQLMTKQAAECDVINSELGAVAQTQGAISSTVIAEGGPMSGSVVGAVQVILSNTGREGKVPRAVVKKHSGGADRPSQYGNNDDFVPLEGLNWRAFGVGQEVRKTDALVHRPRNSVRAKPLSESSPELHKALSDVRHSADHHQHIGASMRSLTDQRGGAGGCTLTYDEVAILFRRFRGAQKGTVQYEGDLLALLDMPSLSVAVKKMVQAYRMFGDYDGLMKEILRHSNAASELSSRDVTEAFRSVFERANVKCRPEELTLLAEKLVAKGSGQAHVTAQQIVEFCADEADRHEWTLVGNRLRLAAQRAALEGADVENLLSEQDSAGTHYINNSRFKDFLRALSKYGNLSPKDINLCCRHFSRRSRSLDENKDSVSLREVMSFLGSEYVGNLQVRIRRVLELGEQGVPDVQEVLRILNSTGGASPRAREQAQQYSYEEVESAFSMLGIYKEVSHEQVRAILKKLDVKTSGKLSAAQVLTYLGIPFKASDLTGPSAAAVKEAYEELDTESLLRLLLDKVQSNGVAMDEAFRHFDVNGDGSITRQEFVQGLTKLRIFDNVPNWKSQLPGLIKKFDVDGNGEVSLREFFKFLGIVEYAPNIIQRMTKIFAVASQKNVSVKDIFVHLDKDNSGQLDATELEAGLKALGTFGEVTRADADAIVKHFDQDGDQHVSIDEFVTYFTDRVTLALKDRRKKKADRVAAILRKTFAGAISKGATLRDIFGHLDKDKSGSIDAKELVATIKKLPSFKKMSDQDSAALMDVLDENKSGDITFEEFESFLGLDDGGSNLDDSMTSIGTLGTSGAPATLLDRIRDTFALAESHGLSFEKAFNLLDKDGSGGITVTEMHAALLKLPNFKNVSVSEVRELFEVIDVDRNGDVSVPEFRNFVRDGKIPVSGAASKRGEQRASLATADTPRGGRSEANMDPERAKELFIRHVRRIAQTDGSVSGLLAYLDDDEDGLIELSRFKNQLRREDVFESIPEDVVLRLLEPVMQDPKTIRAAALLRFIEGGRVPGKGHGEGKEQDDGEQEHVTLPKDYDFSPDPEIRALEKKVRGFGRILSKKGIDVEALFRNFDPKSSGQVRRTELLEVLSKLGMYILEQGKILDQAVGGDQDVQRMQMHQVNRLKGKGGGYVQNAPRMARRMLMNTGDGAGQGDFKDHLESMTLVNWYRQSQKQMLLQRVLSHSLAHIIRIYPRFGKAQFFEYPITNPFAHEERFQIEINDPELRLVTAFDEWLHLRRTCRPAVGELGSEPVEVEMFDRDGQGNIQVALLPHETLYIPFTFMTLLPFVPEGRLEAGQQASKRRSQHGESKHGGGVSRFSSAEDHKGDEGERKTGDDAGRDEEEAQRTVEVKVVSGTHGHIVSILKVMVCPRPFVLNRTLRFQEPENSIMKRRVQIVGHDNMSMFPGEYTTASKFVHCVEGGIPSAGTAGARASSNNPGIVEVAGEEPREQSKVVVEWGPSSEQFSGVGALDLLIRYRCGPFPSTGTFYLLIYNDPYQSQLHEVWQVVVQTRQRLDVHGNVGCASLADLVIRGDRFARRARAYALPSPADVVSFKPDTVFQLVPGAYNRVALSVSPKMAGFRHVQVNLVDEDSRELVSAWLLAVSATSPAVMRSYDVDVPAGRPLHKKIIFKNPWDVPRVFKLSSSDEALMRPRSTTVEVAALGTAYLRLWFSGLESGGAGTREVYLFLNDAAAGQNEECYLFRIRDV